MAGYPASAGRIVFGGFAGGVDLSAWPSEVEDGRFCNGLNMTSEGALGGGVVSRYGVGYAPGAAAPGAGVPVVIGGAFNQLIVQRGTSVSVYTTNTGVYVASLVVSTTALGQAALMDSVWVYAHPVDGVFTITLAGVATNRSVTAKGSAVALWQNKAYVTGDIANFRRVWWSNIGDPTVWTTATDFVDIRDGGDTHSTMTSFGQSQGMDIQGRAGLIVCGPTSTHRINTPSTGAFTTLSTQVGTASQFGAFNVGGFTYIYAGQGGSTAQGVWRTDGLAPPVRVSGPIDGLYAQGSYLSTNDGREWVTGLRGRVFCTVPALSLAGLFPGPLVPSFGIAEYDPAGNAWFLHGLAAGLSNPVFVGLNGAGGGLFAGFTRATGYLGVAFDNGAGSFATGQDATGDGTTFQAIPSQLTTRWAGAVRRYHSQYMPTGERIKLLRALVRGRGSSVTFGVRRDFATAKVLDRTLTAPFSSVTNVDTDTVVPAGGVGPARTLAFSFSASTTTLGTRQGYDELTGATAINTGAWSVERILADYVILGQ